MLVNSSAMIDGYDILTALDLLKILVKVPDHAQVGVYQGASEWQVTVSWDEER